MIDKSNIGHVLDAVRIEIKGHATCVEHYQKLLKSKKSDLKEKVEELLADNQIENESERWGIVYETSDAICKIINIINTAEGLISLKEAGIQTIISADKK